MSFSKRKASELMTGEAKTFETLSKVARDGLTNDAFENPENSIIGLLVHYLYAIKREDAMKGAHEAAKEILSRKR